MHPSICQLECGDFVLAIGECPLIHLLVHLLVSIQYSIRLLRIKNKNDNKKNVLKYKIKLIKHGIK